MDSTSLDILTITLATVILLAYQWRGYYRWIRPHEPLGTQAKIMLMLAIFTLSGGVIGAFGWWLDVEGSFAWDLPPLASRFLATAAWCFAWLSYFALQSPTYRRARLYLVLLALYMAPLTVAILTFHMDRFDWSKPITYAFFTAVTILTGGSVWYWLRQPAILDDRPDELAPTSTVVRMGLGLLMGVTLLWSVALFVTANGPSLLIWAWPKDLLTSRLISVMLLTIAASAWITRRHIDGARLTLQLSALYGLGVAIASLVNPWLAGKPIPMAYLAVMGFICLGSVALLRFDPTIGRTPAR